MEVKFFIVLIFFRICCGEVWLSDEKSKHTEAVEFSLKAIKSETESDLFRSHDVILIPMEIQVKTDIVSLLLQSMPDENAVILPYINRIVINQRPASIIIIVTDAIQEVSSFRLSFKKTD